MKITGIALKWIGIVALLKNMGFIEMIDWNIVWPVLLIIAGASLKHFKHGVACGMGGKCGVCETGNKHVCVGPNCPH